MTPFDFESVDVRSCVYELMILDVQNPPKDFLSGFIFFILTMITNIGKFQ
jgi:hypothetical protein